MKLSLALLSLEASLVLAKYRCDTAKTLVKCDAIPEIMALHTTDCQPYHIFVARGTDERPPGRQGNVTRLICEALGRKHCGFEDIDFPAKSRFVGDEAWCQSAATGAKNGQAQLKKYAERCPDSQLILLGYSQGASIAQDILGGGGGHVFKCNQEGNPALDRSQVPGSKISAAVTFGSVARAASQQYAVKEGRDFNGTRRRTDDQLGGLNQYAGVLRDYCNFGDPICARESHPQSLQNHLTYFEQYNEEIVDWVVKTVRKNSHGSHGPLLHQLSSHYWLVAALLFFLAISWSVLFCYTSPRSKFFRRTYFLLVRDADTP